ncbi:type II toxin-antitoxin system VapB family antitoxin [Spirochaeta africana]|uniref:Transcription regulator of the Arc/MetJ class n=1 Tax=Spirochaeta africana (strain ATCC 700263 / DSM 8902 / Z-7692) TaxID=889378 RepID=H9UGA3_SPIAZ|nr:type II toxin-antitoxin system VapB family antitoxin [Spirochaeta africana]AFG36546.1 hypothetical protein Spiaf_0443 [Spirochaeta africana DSM 8902]
MKRTNLVLDEDLLNDARAISGARTYSEAVNLALRELVRRRTYQQVDKLANSDIWSGNLSEMREDAHVSD